MLSEWKLNPAACSSNTAFFQNHREGVSHQVSAALTGPLHFIADVAVAREG